ncbi:hypothetical protein ACLOJK_001427 [Asimina triloba]
MLILSNKVLVDMIRVPDWAFEAAGQELRGMGQDAAAYHPGLYLTATQREAVEALIQELPKFRLKAVPTDCSECPICLEEFRVGNEVRGLPCAHNFHVECIDEWLRLNVKCPRCRCSVFPNLDLSALSNLHPDTGRSSPSVVTATHYVHTQPVGQSYLVRLQGLLRTIRTENAGGSSDDPDLEATEEGRSTVEKIHKFGADLDLSCPFLRFWPTESNQFACESKPSYGSMDVCVLPLHEQAESKGLSSSRSRFAPHAPTHSMDLSRPCVPSMAGVQSNPSFSHPTSGREDVDRNLAETKKRTVA